MWPLMINCFFMVVISGFLGWLMETWANREEVGNVCVTKMLNNMKNGSGSSLIKRSSSRPDDPRLWEHDR